VVWVLAGTFDTPCSVFRPKAAKKAGQRYQKRRVMTTPLLENREKAEIESLTDKICHGLLQVATNRMSKRHFIILITKEI
jgi:hypothetical protein